MNIYTFRYIHSKTKSVIKLVLFGTDVKKVEKRAKSNSLTKHNFIYDGLDSVERLC